MEPLSISLQARGRNDAYRVAPVSEDPRTVVEAYIAELEGETRQVAFAEWGITVDAAGWPLHVGVAIRDGVLRAQAQVIEPGRIEPHDLLRWNRQIPFLRFAHTRDGEVWIQGDLPLVAVSPSELDRFLGLLVLTATQARQAAPEPAGEQA
jgi:hypothetical protein